MNIKIIKANSIDHFRQVAQLHRDGITEGFLSTLGILFLTKLYMGISKAKNSGVLIAVESVSQLDGKSGSRSSEETQKPGQRAEGIGREVLGFVSYSQDVKSCYKEVLKTNFLKLGFAMIPNAFKLSIYKKVFETLLYPFLHKDNNSIKTTEETTNVLRPELLSMAVSKDARGKGVGKLLVEAIDIAMKEMQIEGYCVVTHGIDERSNGFYQKCGFTKVREFENHEKPMNEYFKKF